MFKPEYWNTGYYKGTIFSMYQSPFKFCLTLKLELSKI